MYTAYTKNLPKDGLTHAALAMKCATELEDQGEINEIKYVQTKLFRNRNEIDSALYTILSIDSSFSAKSKQFVNDQMSRILLDIGAYKSAIPYLKELADNAPNEKNHFYSLDRLAQAFFKLRLYDSTLHIVKRQMAISRGLNDSQLHIKSLSNFGTLHMEMGQFSKAEPFFFQALKEALRASGTVHQDSTIFFKLYQNLAKVYYKLGREIKTRENALKAHKIAMSLFESNKLNWSDVSPSITILFDYYLENNELDNGASLIASLENKGQSSEFLFGLYELKSRLYFALKDYQKMKYFSDMKDKIGEKLVKERGAQLQKKLELLGLIRISNIQNQLAREKTAKEMKHEVEQITQLNTSWIIISIIIIVLISAVLIYENKRGKSKIANELIESKQLNAEYELELKSKDISMYALDLAQREEWRDNLLDDLSSMVEMNEVRMRSRLKDLILKIKSLKASRASIEKLQQNIDVVNTKFYDKLLRKYPKLSRYEQEFCAYIKLGMSNKDIANIKNIDPASVRTSKSRIKKKLGIGTKDIYRYLQDI